METRHYLWLAVGAAGFATGFAIPRLAREPEPAAQPPAATAAAKTARASSRGGTDGALAPGTSTALPVSTDTLASLLELKDSSELYPRLGLWLLDASEGDMAAFWDAYHKLGDTNMWIKDLVFTQWAKKNPRSLIETARRDGEEGPAWWAWTMSDPDAALAAVEGQGKEMRNFALRGLANFHPKRALKMLEADPKLAQIFNMQELAETVGKDDPQAEVEFLLKYNNPYYVAKTLKRWATDDPREALEWLSERGKDPSMRKAFFDTVAEEHPEAFAELAAGLPSGAMKRELESAAFAHFAKTDPERAMEEAKKIELPLLAAERLAQVGKALIAEHPEQALEALSELLRKCPDAPSRIKWTRYPGGGGGGGGGVPVVGELLSELAAIDPRQTMQAVLDSEVESAGAGDPRRGDYLGSAQVTKTWVARDLDGYSRWWEGQQDQGLRDRGAGIVSEQLRGRNDFEGSIDWAMRISNVDQQQNNVSNAFQSWFHKDGDGARQWFEQAPLSEELRNQLKRNLPASEQ